MSTAYLCSLGHTHSLLHTASSVWKEDTLNISSSHHIGPEAHDPTSNPMAHLALDTGSNWTTGPTAGEEGVSVTTVSHNTT